MNRTHLYPAALIAAVGLAALVGSITIADSPGDAKAPGHPETKLPPGWTEADLKACMEAGTPGKNHELLARSVGAWSGKTTMWMAPGAEPGTGDCTATIARIMGGRYIRWEFAGELPGMGPYSGFGIQGFDNVSQKFVTTWIDNHGTGILKGVGELSSDGKTITWTNTVNCPIQRKAVTMREVETNAGPDRKTLEMFGTEPKSGKEFKMMRIELTRRPDAPASPASP